MRRKRAGVILTGVGIVLILAALALTGYNMWDGRRAAKEVNSVLDQFVQKQEALKPDESKAEKETDPQADNAPVPDMPVITVDGWQYIGILQIPALELKLPIMDSWSYPQMKTAPCRYAGSVYQNNLILCAHNYAAHFGRLDDLQVGDQILFTDVNGNVFQYQVQEIQTLSGTAIEEMKSGGWPLTLFTCNFSGQARITVRCKIRQE